MSKSKALLIIVTALLLFAGIKNVASAANACTSNGVGGNFNVTSTWANCGGTTPQAADSITILNGATVTLVATTNVAGITINSGGILGANTRTFTDTGNFTDNGSVTGTTAKLTLSGAGATIDGGGSYAPTGIVTMDTGAKTIASGSSLTFSNVTVTGVTVTNNSTLGFTVTVALAGTGQLAQGTSSVLNLGGTSAITTLNASASANAVHYTSTAAAQTIHAGTYRNLFIDKSGQTGTLGGAITVNGNLTITAGNLADGGFQITGNAAGAFTLPASSTLTLGTAAAATGFPTGFTAGNITLASTSVVNYNANAAQVISNVQAYGNLTLTATATTTKTALGNLTVNSALTVNASNILADGGFVITVKGGSAMNGAHTGTGKILFTGGSAIHSLSGTGSYNNVELDDANGVIQAGGSGNINGTFAITNGTWDVNGKPFTVLGATTVNGTLMLESSGGTKNFGDITVTTSGIINSATASGVAVNGNLTINGSGAITGTIGTWTFQKVGGGIIGGTAPAITILGGTTFATQYSIPSLFTVNTFTVNAGVNETNIGTTTINTALAGAGSFTQSTGTILRLGGSAGITTLNAFVVPNEVHLISTTGAQVIKPTTYYDLFIEKSGQTATVGNGSMTVLGNLMDTAGTINFGGSSSTIMGATDIFDTLTDTSGGPAGGNNVFAGPITVHSGAHWTAIPGEVCDFHFENGLVMDGASFVSATGNYIFESNNQSITGSSAFTIDNVVVSGVQVVNSSALTVRTALTGTGSFVNAAGTTLVLGGINTVSGFDASSTGNTVTYNGSSTQAVNPAIYRTLDVSGNTSNGVTIAANTTALAALVLGPTILTTGASTMIMGPGATLSRTTGFINGNLQKNISGGTSSQSFEVGSGTDYAPVQLNFNAVTVSGNVLVSTTPGDHPNIATSNLFANKTVNRFWTVNNGGVGFGTYNATFNFVPTDVDASATPANFVLAEFSSGAWSRPTLGTVASTSVSATGLSSFGDFQIGEPAVIASKFVILDPGNGIVGTPRIITIQAQDGSNQLAATYNGGVTLVASGTSVTGGGLVTIVNGVGTTTVSTNIAQTVALTLSDTQSTGFDVSSSRFVTFVPGPTAAFVLSHPGSVSTGARAAYTVGHTDQFSNPTSGSSTVVYLYTSSTSTNAAFFSAPTGGTPIATTTILANSTSTQFWYYDTISGTFTITASDNPTAPDGAAGIADATDNLTIAPGAVKFVFANVPGTATAGDTVTFNVEAVDSFGTIDPSFNQDVTVTKTGSASGAPTGGGLVTIINGVGTSTISDTLAETVALALQDTQSAGLNVSSTASVAFSAGPIAKLSLNHPGNMNTGVRLGYVLSSQDQFSNPTSGSSTVVYLYTSSTSTNAAFFSAPTGGTPIATTTILANSTSTQFWYYDTISGTFTITASDNPTAPDGAAGIADATDNLTIAPGAVKFVFANVPGTATAGDTVTFNVEAVDSFGTIDPSFNQDVTVTKTGSASGGGLVDIVNGMATATITDVTAESVVLGLVDSQVTGLGATDARTIAFAATPAVGSAPTVPFVGAPIRPNPAINITLSGWAYPGASISVLRKDLGLTQPPVLQTLTAPADGSFLVKLNNVIRLTGQTYLLVFADKNGVISETNAVNIPAGQENLFDENIVIAPTVGFGGDSVVSRGAAVVLQGYAEPQSVVTLFVDGNKVGTVVVNDTSGQYRYVFDTTGLSVGRHSVAATQIYNKIQSNGSSQQSFTVSPLANPKLDLNGDGTVDIKDISIYLSYLKNLGAGVASFNTADKNLLRVLDLNGDGKLDVQDLSILLHAAGLQ